MTAGDTGWFETLDPDDSSGQQTAIRDGSGDQPKDWPERAVESGFADDESDYYGLLHDATVSAAREAVRVRERADDQQLIHAIRALDDCRRTTNELTERLAEWAGTLDDGATVDVEYVRELARRDPDGQLDERLVSLAQRIRGLDDEATELETFVEQTTPEVAPNLSAMAGPLLAARLIALAGGLQDLARKPSGTVQVLGAEESLFAHLRGGAPSPKHGIIYTHEAVNNTRPPDRGSAARALAGKLTIAARVDYYSGERRPELDRELDARIERIRARDTS